mmetsp:Transcript_23058/g.87190  ORF Transcript_23058/g.87190 Transcript_23058/m.87190 type:complete len:246 (+) Transcript_23058:1255-1992(+)
MSNGCAWPAARALESAVAVGPLQRACVILASIGSNRCRQYQRPGRVASRPRGSPGRRWTSRQVTGGQRLIVRPTASESAPGQTSAMEGASPDLGGSAHGSSGGGSDASDAAPDAAPGAADGAAPSGEGSTTERAGASPEASGSRIVHQNPQPCSRRAASAADRSSSGMPRTASEGSAHVTCVGRTDWTVAPPSLPQPLGVPRTASSGQPASTRARSAARTCRRMASCDAMTGGGAGLAPRLCGRW